ncbi:MAG TPA: hypothetical protein VEN81_16395, partial [Planctomycetota bacterium]|nr:hypothetical protein [Planctomycetota bacterium]
RGGGDVDRGAAAKPGANTNMIVAASIGGLLVLGVVAYALSGKSSGSGKGGDHSEVSDKKKKKDKDSTPASGAKSSSTGGGTSGAATNPFSSAPSVPAGAFQPGARGQVDKTTVDVNLVRDPARKADYEAMASAGRIADIVNQDGHLILFIIDGMLSDTEAVARTSMQAMHEIILKRGLQKSVGGNSDLVRQANIQGFESAQNRATEYGYWVMAWWYNRGNQDLVEKWKSDAGAPYVPPPSASPASTSSGATGATGGSDWDQTMTALRSGGGFDNQNSPEYPYFMHVKSMGKSAYPNIVKYIDHEDPAMGKAAVALLVALTGRAEERRLNDSNKTAIKADWEAWLKTQ